jgi:hypothetical protein
MGVRFAAIVALLAVLGTGCFGYNRPAKKWAYVGNTVLMLGGGAVIAADQLGASDSEGLSMTAAEPYDPPFSGVMLAGVVLVAAGLVGMIFNATRPEVKTSR